MRAQVLAEDGDDDDELTDVSESELERMAQDLSLMGE